MPESFNKYYKTDNRHAFFTQKWTEQDGRCAICGEKSRLVIDHDHKSGMMRGLLCYKHNTAIGMFGDSKDLLQKSIEYLNTNTPVPLVTLETPTRDKHLRAEAIIPQLLIDLSFTSDRARAKVLSSELNIKYNTAVSKVRRARARLNGQIS